MRFKSGFGPQLVQLVEPRNVVFSPARFALFKTAYPLVTRHRHHVLPAMRAVARRRESVAAGQRR